MILYTWKIMEKLAPNCGLVWEANERTGRTCSLQSISREASTKVRSLRNSSFQIRGPILFNSMPLELRNLSGCNINSFKNRLDALLNMLPDTPISQKYYPVPINRHTSKPSNSVIEWIQYLGIPIRRMESLSSILESLQLNPKFQELKTQLNLPDRAQVSVEPNDPDVQLTDDDLEDSLHNNSTL